MSNVNRIGRVSAIDYAAGTYEVTYSDRGKSVTRQINAVSNGEYRMPVVGQVVSVSHNSNGEAAGVSVGTVWNRSNRPVEGFKGLYRKEYASRQGVAYERFDENTGVYTLVVNTRAERRCGGTVRDKAGGAYELSAGRGMKIEVEGGEAKITLNGAVITVSEAGDVSIDSPTKITLTAPEISAEAESGDVSIEGVSLVNHTHRDGGAGAPYK